MYRESHTHAIAILTFSIRPTPPRARRGVRRAPGPRARARGQALSASLRRTVARGDEIALLPRTAAVTRHRLERQRHRLRAEPARAVTGAVVHQVEDGTARRRNRARGRRPRSFEE